MPIRVTRKGTVFEVDTPEEAVKLQALLEEREADTLKRRAFDRATAEWGLGTVETNIVAEFGTWTPELFLRFVARLGSKQKAVLSALISRRTMTDAELREAVGVTGNQALAGILSGISKQAASLDLPARDIFIFENSRSEGKRSSTYSIAGKFGRIAEDMNWPTVSGDSK